MQSKSFTLLTSLGFSALLLAASPAAAQAPSLGTAQSFAVMGGSTVTNTGATSLTGDLGVSPGTAITGFPPGILTGSVHAGDALALQAQGDITTAYDALVAATCTTDLTGLDLGGLTLTPGVYCFTASAPLNGILTLDALGDPDAVFIFKIGSTLLAAINSSVLTINSAQESNVFWQVGSSATLAAGVAFEGNIIALESITVGAGSNVSGRVLARTGAVTLDFDSISAPSSGGCGTTASVAPFVSGCGPQAPIIDCMVPVLGTSVTINLTGSMPLKVAYIMATPLGVSSRSLHGCPVYYDSVSTLVLKRFVTNATGNDQTIQLPNDSVLCGSQWTLQGLVFTPGLVSISNTLLCTLGT